MRKCKKWASRLFAVGLGIWIGLLTIIWIWYRSSCGIAYLLTGKLQKMDLSKAQNLMIVAHPDDETLWGGAHLLLGGYLIVCMTHGNDAVRSAELQAVADATGNLCLILSYPDKIMWKRDDWKQVKSYMQQDISFLLTYQNWNSIVTHNENGEYGHVHHKMTHAMTVEAYQEAELEIPLYFFGTYYSKIKLPDYADNMERLSDMQIQQKETLLSLYSSQKKVIHGLEHMNPYENWLQYE